MYAPFPCPNPPSTCETNPNPLTSFSSEAADSTTFIGLAWNNQFPALNKPFNVFPCEAIVESQLSQADADRIASNQAVNCSNPCAPVFLNTAQSATGICANGSSYSLTIPAGIFTADNQVLADRKAFAAATDALRGHSICLGLLSPASACKGDFYFGIISLITTDAPSSIVLLTGDLPDGLTLTAESDRVVIQGTPISFGASQFILQATSAANVVTQLSYAMFVTGIVTDSALPGGTTGDVYDTQLVAILPDGAVAQWSVSGGTLPDGLVLDSSTGSISGTPTTVGDNSFTVSVTDGISTCSKDFTISVQSGSNICTDGIGGLSANRYSISGYFDGLIPNPNGPSGNPAWDGVFTYYMDGNAPNAGFTGWATGGFVSSISMAGNDLCSVAILFAGCIGGVPQWQIWIGDIFNFAPGGQIWYGEKVGGQTPEGVYNLTAGADISPLTLTIQLFDQTAVPAPGGFSCAS